MNNALRSCLIPLRKRSRESSQTRLDYRYLAYVSRRNAIAKFRLEQTSPNAAAVAYAQWEISGRNGSDASLNELSATDISVHPLLRVEESTSRRIAESRLVPNDPTDLGFRPYRDRRLARDTESSVRRPTELGCGVHV